MIQFCLWVYSCSRMSNFVMLSETVWRRRQPALHWCVQESSKYAPLGYYHGLCASSFTLLGDTCSAPVLYRRSLLFWSLDLLASALFLICPFLPRMPSSSLELPGQHLSLFGWYFAAQKVTWLSSYPSSGYGGRQGVEILYVWDVFDKFFNSLIFESCQV